MESPPSYYSPPPMIQQQHADASRPSLGFPLGTALLLIVIFSLSGIFSCCYHWDKLRSLRRSFADGSDPDPDSADQFSPSKPKNSYSEKKQSENQSLPVVMPGEKIPRFIALPCPCEPPRQGKIVVQVQKPPNSKPPHIAAVPFY